MKKIRPVIISALLLLSVLTLAACAKNNNTGNGDVSYGGTDVFWSAPGYGNVVYSVKTDKMSAQEIETAVSLQGIVAQTQASIFIDSDAESRAWLDKCASDYGLKIVNVDSVWDLIDIFRRYVTDGKYVLYNSTYDAGAFAREQTINYATVVAGVEKYLMISKDLEATAVENGLTLGKDVTSYNTASVFAEYKDRLNKSVLIHQEPSKWQLRDYAIASKAMCFYSDFYDGSSDSKNEILSWADDNAPILGWTENEINFVASNSLHSKITVAADWSTNLSFTSALENSENYTPENYQKRTLKAENGKHYLAIVMSDGDNLQWMENGFATDKKYFGSAERGNFPMTWTIAPSMYNLQPQILDYLYENGTASDEFIAGPSGAGYVNISEYNENSLSGYAKITASYMNATGLGYVNFLDDTADPSRLDEFTKYDSVKGGIWSVGNKYIDGNGALYWSNGKPVVCARETLWRIAGNDDSNAYYGFTERVAQRINNYKTDPTTIEGYTVLIAHAWSIGTMDYIARFVEQLDEHVELVTVGELLDLVSENVKHEDVETLDDIAPSDIAELATIGSEQYNVKTLSGIPVDEGRSYSFDNKSERKSYKWLFGNGGLQYDSAGYASEGIKLDGSDLNDVIDPLPNSWTVNKFELTEQDKYLTVFASHSANADVNFRVRALTVENEKLVSYVLESPSYEKTLNEYGWYKMDGGSPMVYFYDLSQFANKTVAISLEQDDTGDGSGEVVFISKLVISSEIEDGRDKTAWDISDIAAFWKQSGLVSRHSEGICLEGKDASVSTTVTVAGNTLKIAMRKFERPLFQTQDITAYVTVKFNGEIIRVKGAVSDYIDVANTDEYYYYTFDISAFRGQTGVLEIISVEVGGVVGQHACISEIHFE